MVDAFEARMKPKRKWGDAPAVIAKVPAGCWHWTCTICSPFTQRTGCGAELAEAMAGLEEHQKRHWYWDGVAGRYIPIQSERSGV
jgi:hypothetical protein